jgi:probable rRNA maturation factor
MKRAARGACRIDVLVESDLWKQSGKVKSMARRAVKEAAAALSTRGAELAIVLTDDSAIRLLNRDWRGIDAATNVLSFPTESAAGEPPLLGDIVLAYETIAREARAEHKPLAHHVAHLAVHGFLHLNGYDHERDADAKAMEQAERKILRRIAIPDPYRARRKTSNKNSKQSAKTR